MEKLKVGIITNCVTQKTGLGRNVGAFLPLLYKTGKYEIFFLNQGFPDNHPDYLKLPWKNEGIFKNVDQARFQNPQEENYRRIVAYGNTAVEEFVTKNKLDVVIALDDPWAFLPDFYFKTDWYQHIKQNFLPVITADSEPILPLIKEWAQNCPNMWFWSTFAERILKQENPKLYGHCKTVHGAINTNNFKPLPKEERLALRRRFGIQDDEKIILYLGRNQLRKLFFAHMEALADIRKKFPQQKIRLLFHCFWSEPMGWPLNNIREELGLRPEDVLTTYFCKKCGSWEVQPFKGEDLDCEVCGEKRGRKTAGVDSNINEENLNKIYNLADASASIFTSGGQEYTNVESLLAGLPLGCVNYSSGEDFTANKFVYTITGTFTRECNSGFKKFVPNIASVRGFFDHIYTLSPQRREEIVRRGREWAIKEYSAESIAKKYEEFLDQCKPIDWEPYFSKKKEIKNVNASVQDFPNDDDFIKHAYKTILNMDLDKSDSGFQHWQRFLAQPGNKMELKQNMIQAFRNAAIQHNQKVQPEAFSLAAILDKDDKERVLLVLKESIGDLYILTSLLPSIKEKYKDAAIYLACDQKYWDIFAMNPHIKKLLPWSPEMDNEMIMTGFANNKGLFNYYHNVGIATQKLLNYLSSKY